MKPCLAFFCLVFLAGASLVNATEPTKVPGRHTKILEGWTLFISDELLEKDKAATERALELLTIQLQEIARVVPAAAVAELKKVPLWFSREYRDVTPRAEYHPDAGWLRENNRDPAMEKAIEFTCVRIFERETKRMPNFALHELAHAYHDRVLSKGFGNEEIKAAFERAKTSGLYDRVEQRFGDGSSANVRAYAITNPMEYFAECSEAYFSTNDFYPFSRQQLAKYDPEMFALLTILWGDSAGSSQPVKVFILAGQSNMEGHGKVNAEPKANDGKGSLEWIVKDPDTAPQFKHLVDIDGNWIARDDVQIWYLGRKGNLAPGFGVREGHLGPELGFGHVVGEAFEEPVLLIKLAWGGKSLAQDFRPPSSGGDVGPYYQELLKHTKEVLRDAQSLFPEYADHKLELAGFGWHQGWNDRVNQAFNDEYEKNLANFIRDIRKDLGVPKLPFVIAETGMSGREEKHPRALSLMKAQAAVAQYDEFQGNVAFVGTRDFYRSPEESPADQAYHWNCNAETYYLIGDGMGKAMVKLLEQ